MKLSVITINYNNCNGLKKTIESVVNQTSIQYEYIIIDGGSTDGSVDVIKEYADKIDYWVSEPDKGPYNAMNKGARVATGDYVIFMNSGDYFYSNDIVNCFLFSNPTEDVICGNVYRSTGQIDIPPIKENLTFLYFYKYSLPHQACFIKTSVQKQFPYNENLKIVSDWEFFLKILIINNGTYRKIDKIISYYDCCGISSINHKLHANERVTILQSMFPNRILEDYRLNTASDFRRLFLLIAETKIHKPIYVINVLLIKFISLFTGSKWINDFKIKEKV
ncbi:MAG: glycosyltransferase [Bacteroidaceae bacterium]|nr:glycosyltransferase [Bacteroidaceae bacterium]